jgi:hypothetical protein
MRQLSAQNLHNRFRIFANLVDTATSLARVQEITPTASKSNFRGSWKRPLQSLLLSATRVTTEHEHLLGDLVGDHLTRFWIHTRLNASHAVCFGQQRSLNDLQCDWTTFDAEYGNYVRETHLIPCISQDRKDNLEDRKLFI